MKVQMIAKAICLTVLASWLPITPSIAQRGPGQYGDFRHDSFLYVCTNDGDSVNLRSDAGQQHKVILSVSYGEELTLLKGSKIVGNNMWRNVRFYGVAGWVRGDFLCK